MQTRGIISAGVIVAMLCGLAAATPVGDWVLALAAPPEKPALPGLHPRRRTSSSTDNSGKDSSGKDTTSPVPLDEKLPQSGISEDAKKVLSADAKKVLSADAKKVLADLKAKANKATASTMPPLPVRKPKPRPPTTPEGKFRASLDASVSPLLAIKISDSDASTLIASLKAIKRSKLQTAAKLRISLSDPTARKLVDWYRLRAGFGTPNAYATFLNANPTWPDRKLLKARAEEQAFTSGGSAGSITAYFKQFPPRTAAGYAALASAHLAQNDKATAQKLASKAWRELSLATSLETGFLKRFAPLLSSTDHKWRINRLLLNDSRHRSTRRRRAAKIKRLIPLLGNKIERQKIAARLAVYLRQRKAKTLMATVLHPPPLPKKYSKEKAAKPAAVPAKPDEVKDASAKDAAKNAIAKSKETKVASDNNIVANKDTINKDASTATGSAPAALVSVAPGSVAMPPTDWGLEFQRVQLLRRQKKYAAARQILLAAPADPTMLVNPDAWWKEKRTAAHKALELGKVETAFRLASNPGPISVNPRKDAAFLAGWIAYRHLSDPKAAIKFFQIMREAADGPLSASRAGYWLARAARSSDPATAKTARQEAASYNHTFYGQLARQTIDPDDRAIPITTPALPSETQATRFNAMDALKAAVIAYRAGLSFPIRRAFFNHLRYNLADEADMIMLAHLANALGDTQMSVRIGKTGVVHKQNLYYYSYPIRPLPDYNPLRTPPEKALLLGVARQESEFNTTIRSGAGARGILQIMPITARHVCNVYKIRCRISQLTTDHTFNTMIGSAYLADRLDDFSGSYALTLSGYNAGPGRTRQWIKRFGDPRDQRHDMLDWIERIPFDETRTYVKKVLSNIQIYRARLGNEASALQLLGDLSRAQRGSEGQKAVVDGN